MRLITYRTTTRTFITRVPTNSTRRETTSRWLINNIKTLIHPSKWQNHPVIKMRKCLQWTMTSTSTIPRRTWMTS